MSETFVPSRALDPTQTPFQNILVNGGFEQWDKGDSFVNPLDGQALMSGWNNNVASATAYSVAQEQSNIDPLSGANSVNLTITSTPGTGNFFLSQNSVGVASWHGKTVSLSVRVKTTVAGKVCVAIYDGILSSSNYHTGSGNWETLTVPAKAIISAPSFLQVYVGFLGNGTATGTVYIDSAMLVLGGQSTNFIPEQSPEIDLLKTGLMSSYKANAQASNLLTNGGFNVWQRGTSFSNLATTLYCADKWQIEINGAAPTYTLSKETSVTDNSPSALKFQITSTNGQHIYLYQALENYTAYAGQALTFSIRVKTNATNFSIAMTDGIAGTTPIYHPGDNNWHTLTVTKVISGSTALIWVFAGFIISGQQQTSISYLDNAILVVGGTPVPFAQVHPADELARCLRYYEKGFQRLTSALSYEPAENIETGLVWKMTKSAAPTVTPSNRAITLIHVPTDGASGVSNDSANWDSGSSDSISISECRLRFSRTGSQTTYNSALVTYNWVAEVT